MKDAIVVLTPEQLRAIVSDAVTDALAKAGAGVTPADVLSCEQAAELIGVNPRTVPRLVRDKGLPTLRRIGKLWRFSRRDVLAWLTQRKSA
jgi:excisionase family DNA binding protein